MGRERIAAASAGCANQAGVPREMRAWNRDYPPFKVIGNIYYIGSNAVAQFLIATPAGHILLDSGFEASVPRLRAHVESLGFRFGPEGELLHDRYIHEVRRRKVGAKQGLDPLA